MADQIQILRGTRDEIVASKDKILLEGQPLYNETDKYLTIGSSGNTSPIQQPIAAREIHGYFADASGIVATTATGSRYGVRPQGTNIFEVYSDGRLELNGGDDLLLKSKRIEINPDIPVLLSDIHTQEYVLNAGRISSSNELIKVPASGTFPGGSYMLTQIAESSNDKVLIGTTGSIYMDREALGGTDIGGIGPLTFFRLMTSSPKSGAALPRQGYIYTCPVNTDRLTEDGGSVRVSDEEYPEVKLASIIYNIGQRLDSLGFKREVVQDEDGDDLLEFSKIGYYVFVKLLQTVYVNYGDPTCYVSVPGDFKRHPQDGLQEKALMITTHRSGTSTATNTFKISYTNDHRVKFSQSGTSAGEGSGMFAAGTSVGYDLRQ